MQTDLSQFDIGDYHTGNKMKVIIWYIVNYLIFKSSIPWPYKFKVLLLRLFGARIGKGIVIKPNVRIKCPWRITIGNYCWIGEDVWIDNLGEVEIGSNVCLSQGAMLLTGNHDYTLSDFPYRLGNIKIENGVWIGAKSIVCPGVTCKSHSVLTVNSVASNILEESQIYSGNPATFIRQRVIRH